MKFQRVRCRTKNNTRNWMYHWRTQEYCSGGGSTNSVEDGGRRERGSGGSCNLVLEISFHIVKLS